MSKAIPANPPAALDSGARAAPRSRSTATGAARIVAGAKDNEQVAQADSVPGAKKAPLPEKLSPQLATLVSSMPARGDWLYEIKFDGYRILTRFENGKPRLITRRGNDWSAKMPGLLAELGTMGVRSGWLDGEIVVLNDDGVPNFNALQNVFDQGDSAEITYFLFDVPFFEGYDLRAAELRYRRQLLEAFVKEKGTGHVRWCADPTVLVRGRGQATNALGESEDISCLPARTVSHPDTIIAAPQPKNPRSHRSALEPKRPRLRGVCQAGDGRRFLRPH